MLNKINTYIRLSVVPFIKKLLKINNLSLFLRKTNNKFQRIIYHRKYNAQDIVHVMRNMGLKRGDTLVIHCAMNNFYNYKGTAEGLIAAILEYIGPEGTLCMPGYPYEKDNPSTIFDVRADKTAAGFLAEKFRNWPGVKRSINHEHSVSALGPNADFILNDHSNSTIRFDIHSPYYKLYELNALSFSFGMPKYFIGTIEHVSEALLYDKVPFFNDKFIKWTSFKCIDYSGSIIEYKSLTGCKFPFLRDKNSRIVDKYFDSNKYRRKRLSNIWINMYDVKYTVDRLYELGRQGISLYGKIPFDKQSY